MSATPEAFDTGLRPEDVDPARPRPIDTPWGSMSIFACAGELLAVQSFCPHLMGPLFQGTVSGETVTCPWHQWRFSLRTGARVDAGRYFGPRGDDAALLVCDADTGPRGTIVLSRPRHAASRERGASCPPSAP
jgi:nitrite reductase/ring-hydroxylating ferredoxin subunit